MNTLSTEQLNELFINAQEKDVSKDFIMLLAEEINKRVIDKLLNL